MVEQLEPIQVSQIQELGTIQQCEFRIEVITPWLYKLVIEEDYKSGTSKHRNLQKISYWCYYYIHSIHGQIQIELSAALTHLKAYRLSGGSWLATTESNPQRSFATSGTTCNL